MIGTTGPRTPRWSLGLSWLSFLVPPAFLAVCWCLQPDDRLGDPDVKPPLGRLLYDDYDPACRALRGLNASLGRTAGRLDEPEWFKRGVFAQALDLSRSFDPVRPELLAVSVFSPQMSCPGNLPWAALYRGSHPDRYFLEYPHTALLMFRLAYAAGNRVDPALVPAAVRDGDFHNLVTHEPRDGEEKQLWRHLRRAIRFHAALGTVCLLAMMAVLFWGCEPAERLSNPVWLAVLPATLYFAVHRFDVVPALLTALSLACLARRRVIASGALLATAVMIKVYPVLLAPLILRYLSAERRPLLLWTAAGGVTAAALLAPPLLLSGWEATVAPYRFQLSRAPEGWTLYGCVLPWFLAEGLLGSAFRNGVALLALLALCWRRPADLTGLRRRGAVVLLLFVSLQVFYSPQWIIWFTPFLVPLAGRNRSVLWLTVALDLLTYNSFPVVFDLPADPGTEVLRAELIWARAAVCAALVWVLLRAESAPREPGAPPPAD